MQGYRQSPITVCTGVNPAKNAAPIRMPNTMMMMAWMNDFVTPERPIPKMMWLRSMGLARISRISPQFLSKRITIPPKRLVNSVVIAMIPAPMKVRYPTGWAPEGNGIPAVSWSKLLDIAIPKNAIQSAGWRSEETRSVLNRTKRIMSRQ